MNNRDTHEILLLVAAMIAGGKAAYSDSTIHTCVKQAVAARHQIHKYAKIELDALAEREAKEQAEIAAAERNSVSA